MLSNSTENLSTRGVTKSYKGRKVVGGVDLDIGRGEIVGLLGPNGAGKTTTFYTIVGLVRPDSGQVMLGDRDITLLPMFERSRAGLSYLPQEASVFRKLSVEDNILAILEILPEFKGKRSQQKERLDQLIEELNLQKGIGQLPEHEPPKLVWESIEVNLVKHAENAKPRLFWRKRWSTAASFLLLIGASWWAMNQAKTTESFQYAQETIDVQLLEADWDEDGEALAQIEAICKAKAYTCALPEFRQLEQELEELNEAKSDLKQAIEDFGKDTQLIAQLSEVELERTTILKKMMANIL